MHLVKNTILLILLLGQLISHGQSVQGNRFSAYIKQHNKQIEIVDHQLFIQRDTFEIVVDLPTKYGVFVHASFYDSTMIQVRDNRIFSEISNFQSPAIFEMWRNPFNELLICDSKPQYWFIESSQKHRFSSYENRNGRLYCVKKIAQFYDLEHQTVIPLAMIDSPIFVSFISFSPAGDDRRSEEIMRHEFVIRWLD